MDRSRLGAFRIFRTTRFFTIVAAKQIFFGQEAHTKLLAGTNSLAQAVRAPWVPRRGPSSWRARMDRRSPSPPQPRPTKARSGVLSNQA